MDLDIRYTTRFTYSSPVRESVNELRACPTSDEHQQLVSYRVATVPAARVLSTIDHFGTRVDAFGVREPHQALEIVAEATVRTRPPALLTASPRLADVAEPAFRDAHAEYLAPSAHTASGPAIARLARERADALGDDLVGVVLALHRSVGQRLVYRQGTTYVGVPLDEVFERSEGVCQDYAHLLVALCRALGIPARYVSGYLFAVDDATGAAGSGNLVEVQTHAWAEVAVPGAGWMALDPTNRQEVGERHVKIGHGRDYDDVPPLRGVFSGPADAALDVSVQMRRLWGGRAEQAQQQ